jgi:hypothetical protein
MDGGMRSKTVKVDSAQDSGKGKRLAFGAALLAGSLMGCGDVNNFYYYGKDGGELSDSRKPDSGHTVEGLVPEAVIQKSDKGVPDAKKASDAACVPKSVPLSCQNMGSPVAGILNQGESFQIGGGWRFALGDVTYAICPPKALMELQDSCGKAVMKYALPEGPETAVQVQGVKLLVGVKKVAAGFTFGAKWTDITLRSTCSGIPGTLPPTIVPTASFWCKTVSGQLNQGESLSFGTFKLQLDDLMVLQCAQKQYALVSVLDSKGNILAKKKIQEGAFEVLALNGVQYRINIPTVGAGGTFAEKWADIEILAGQSTKCK